MGKTHNSGVVKNTGKMLRRFSADQSRCWSSKLS